MSHSALLGRPVGEVVFRPDQDRIFRLSEDLQSEDDRGAAFDALHSPVDEMSHVPKNGELSMVLRGDLG